MQSFGAILKFDPHYCFNRIIQTILVMFSMKTSRACTGMLSSENNDFKFLKTAKTTKSTCITRTIVTGLAELFYPNQTSLSLTIFTDDEYTSELKRFFPALSKSPDRK